MEAEELKLKEFIDCLDSMVDGKYILADIKIKKLMSLIVNSEELYELVSKCCEGFDFAQELSKSEVKNRFNNGVFNMPKDDKSIVAFVYNLFNDINNKKLDFFRFLNENFYADSNAKAYEDFINIVLKPFENSIIRAFSVSSEEFFAMENQSLNNNVVNIYSTLEDILSSMKENIALERRIRENDKENLKYIINSAIHSLKYEDLKLINGFICVLDVLSDKYAALRLPLKEIKEELMKYYNSK